MKKMLKKTSKKSQKKNKSFGSFVSKLTDPNSPTKEIGSDAYKKKWKEVKKNFKKKIKRNLPVSNAKRRPERTEPTKYKKKR